MFSARLAMAAERTDVVPGSRQQTKRASRGPSSADTLGSMVQRGRKDLVR